jgi:hypothetical protein
VSFSHAVELLRKDFMPADTAIRTRPPAEPLLDSPLEPDAEDHELAAQVIDYYHQQLKQSPKALANLEQRGLVHGGVAPLCQGSCRVWSMRKYQKGQP